MVRDILMGSSIAVALLAGPAAAQDFSGVWVHGPEGSGSIRLVLQQEADGRVRGSLSGAGTTVRLEGVVRDETLVARSETESGLVLLEADLIEDGLELLLASPDASGEPDYERARTLEFVREGAAATPRPPSSPEPPAPAMTRDPSSSPTGPTADSPLSRQWDGALRGKKLTQLDSHGDREGGYSFERELHLCSSGEFTYRSVSRISVDVGGAFGNRNSQDSGTGRWQVLSQGELVGLDLRFTDGRHWQVRLDHQGGATYVDGKRVYVTPGEVCP